jgi:NAD(P)-dependent dehydrogenase (short-subunit alcohol dehydrogenase family)
LSRRGRVHRTRPHDLNQKRDRESVRRGTVRLNATVPFNTVSPGSFATESLCGWAKSVGIDPTDLYAVMAGIEEHFGHPAHLPRAGDPAEIGAVIAFVASRRNTYMTGANINVDGGSDFC